MLKVLRPDEVSPLPDDPVGVLGHVVVADDVVHARQGLVHVLLQTLQILRLLVDGDDGVLQLHQAALEGRQDGDLRGSNNKPPQGRSEERLIPKHRRMPLLWDEICQENCF